MESNKQRASILEDKSESDEPATRNGETPESSVSVVPTLVTLKIKICKVYTDCNCKLLQVDLLTYLRFDFTSLGGFQCLSRSSRTNAFEDDVTSSTTSHASSLRRFDRVLLQCEVVANDVPTRRRRGGPFLFRPQRFFGLLDKVHAIQRLAAAGDSQLHHRHVQQR